MTSERTETAVEAVFAGEPVRLELSREPMPLASLEAAIGPAYAAYRRFLAEDWSLREVRLVIAHAWPDAVLLDGLTRVETVEAETSLVPAATYAPLAALVLEAMIFGLEPVRAVFPPLAVPA